MKFTKIDIGEIIAFIIAIIFVSTKIISLEIFLLFILLKLELSISFK